jgi:hypothetical protein
MKAADRARLTTALREHVAKSAVDRRAMMRAAGPVRERARRLHADEQVGEDFDVWTDLLSRRASVLWVLKSVYVRVLEDRGLVKPERILDPEAQQLFERLAPNLGETSFLRWVYRDLASSSGGLPELFSPQPAEVALPSDDLSRDLISFLRHRDPDTGGVWSFAEERFEGELMGDLYQELDPVVKDRFALCQTPDFVRAFILDRTLMPAIETFGADEVRLLDPACGSGHFLIDGLKRLVGSMGSAHPDWDCRRVVMHCLERIVGIDLNDYACALARSRLVMTAAELAGVTTLVDAATFHPHVYWADGLEQVEKGKDTRGQQLDLLDLSKNEAPRASLTRPEARAALHSVLESKFHAVVANPPYITEKDAARKRYHREKIGRAPRYRSAYREYSLASPFTERCFQLALDDGFVGIITSNNFMKREFGKSLIESVLRALDLTLVVDTSQAYIPFHGTATVLLFARNRPPTADFVRAVMGKRGEIGTPQEPARGKVWVSIAQGWGTPGFENEFVSVAELPRTTLTKHPWSLGGGGAAELRQSLEDNCPTRLGAAVERIGFMTILKQDDVFLGGPRSVLAEGLVNPIDLVEGTRVRDYAIDTQPACLFPYDRSKPDQPLALSPRSAAYSHFWKYRKILQGRTSTGFRTVAERGLLFYEYAFYFPETYTSTSITFAFVATHNHFVLDRGGKVFNRSAPVIKLPTGSTEEDHLSLLGLLNSSAGCFWMKQVFHCKGSQGINEGLKSSLWEQFFEFDATKLRLFPVAKDARSAIPFAKELDSIAQQRQHHAPSVLLRETNGWSDAKSLSTALRNGREADLKDLCRMVALQEELDWLCYRLYGLENNAVVAAPSEVEPISPTWLPWVLNLAARDVDSRTAMDRGEDPGESPTIWFARHRWQPIRELPREASSALRKRTELRRARIKENPALSLIETAGYKRRWYRPDYEAVEKAALGEWLADRIEDAARARGRSFTVDQIAAALQDEQRVLAVSEVLTGRPDFNFTQLVQRIVHTEAVPNHRFHLYKDTGLAKRAAWERTWDDQRREDAGEKVSPEAPPTYIQADFLKPDYFRHRGKLDVPRERFVAFTEAPRRDEGSTTYGWAGWSPSQRLKAMLAMDEEFEDAGVPLADRIGLLDSAWRHLQDVAREDQSAANRLKAELQAMVGTEGPSRQMVDEWRRRFPPLGSRTSRIAEPDHREQESTAR